MPTKATPETIILAIMASLLVIYEAHVSRQYIDRRLIIKLELRRVLEPNILKMSYEFDLSIANNNAYTPFSIQDVGISIGRRKLISITNLGASNLAIKTPYSLEPGTNRTHSFSLPSVRKILVSRGVKGKFTLRAAIKDGVGRIHIGKDGILMEIKADEFISLPEIDTNQKAHT